MLTTTTTSRKLVPQRGWKRDSSRTFSTVSSLAVLVAEDGLMLRAMVGEQALHVAHAGTQLHVRKQDDDAHKTL